MPTAEASFNALTAAGITHWVGVPDSLLKPLCSYVDDHVPTDRHVIAANEGGAVAIAVGHYIGTQTPAAVYLQNSGLGNAINPLVSLADPAVYAIPMVLVIGWRGEPGTSDEPQHMKQGQSTIPMLEAAGIPYETAPADIDTFQSVATSLVSTAMKEQRPVALLVPKNTFSDYHAAEKAPEGTATLTREEAIAIVADGIESQAVIVATTGKAARELYEHRTARGQSTERDFLIVGSMGHASQIALGLAMADAERPVWVLDGDGALIMHMGSLTVIGQHAPPNLHHVLLNNGVHDSVGGQPTPTRNADLVAIASAAGYVRSGTAMNKNELVTAVHGMSGTTGPSFLEVRVAPGARADLGRPSTTPRQNKEALMDWLSL
jgi:phosphonopyruvate decarboxylase